MPSPASASGCPTGAWARCCSACWPQSSGAALQPPWPGGVCPQAFCGKRCLRSPGHKAPKAEAACFSQGVGAAVVLTQWDGVGAPRGFGGGVGWGGGRTQHCRDWGSGLACTPEPVWMGGDQSRPSHPPASRGRQCQTPAHGFRAGLWPARKLPSVWPPPGPLTGARGWPRGLDGDSHLAPCRSHPRASPEALPAPREPHAPLLGGEGSPGALGVRFPEHVTPVALGPGPETNPRSRSWTQRLPVSSPGRLSPTLSPPLPHPQRLRRVALTLTTGLCPPGCLLSLFTHL